MVCLEATLCGLPVVVSSNSVGTDLVSDLNGRIFNSGNLEDLKIAMKSVYDNYEQFDRVEIRTTTIKKYNKENYISAYLEMLGNFIDK
jgi:glycosyltransferase involved in cell wall biosynthesis